MSSKPPFTTNNTQSAETREEKLSPAQATPDKHDVLINYLLIGIISSIALLALNILRENYINDRLTEFAIEAANSRMEISKNEQKYQETVLNLQKDIELFKQCLKFGGWKECFESN